MCASRHTTKTSVLEKQRTRTPTSLVSVIPLQKVRTINKWEFFSRYIFSSMSTIFKRQIFILLLCIINFEVIGPLAFSVASKHRRMGLDPFLDLLWQLVIGPRNSYFSNLIFTWFILPDSSSFYIMTLCAKIQCVMDMHSYQVNILLAVNSCSRKYCLIVISVYKQADSLFLILLIKVNK